MNCNIKGLFTDFAWGVQGTVSSSRIRFTSKFGSIIFIPVAAAVDFMGLRISPIVSLLLLAGHFGPIRDAIKSAIAATGIKGKGKRFFHILKPYF